MACVSDYQRRNVNKGKPTGKPSAAGSSRSMVAMRWHHSSEQHLQQVGRYRHCELRYRLTTLLHTDCAILAGNLTARQSRPNWMVSFLIIRFSDDFTWNELPIPNSLTPILLFPLIIAYIMVYLKYFLIKHF